MASQKISQMPSATELNGEDLLPIVQEFVNKKITLETFQEKLSAIPSKAIIGTIADDDAPDGGIGQFIEGSVDPGSAIDFPPLTVTEIASIEVPHGDWELSGMFAFNIVADIKNAFSCGYLYPGDTEITDYFGAVLWQFTSDNGNGDYSFSLPTVRLRHDSLTPKTVRICALMNYSSGSAFIWGKIRARRVR